MMSFQYLPLYSTAGLSGVFQTCFSALGSEGFQRYIGMTRQKKGQGFYNAVSHARLHMQPPIAVLALLWFYQQRSSSQQSVCSEG